MEQPYKDKTWKIFNVSMNHVEDLEKKLNEIDDLNYDIFKILKSIDTKDGQMKWNIVCKKRLQPISGQLYPLYEQEYKGTMETVITCNSNCDGTCNCKG